MSSACNGHTGRLVDYFAPMLEECERRKADLKPPLGRTLGYIKGPLGPDGTIFDRS